jgi:D-alanyl-D-alanine carboxypeptidase
MSVVPAPARPLRLRWLFMAVALLVGVGVLVLLREAGVLRSGSPPERPELQRILDSAVTGNHRLAPGATAYVSGLHGTWLGSAGVADVDPATPMQPDARMRLESVSKIFTAALVLQLAQEGALDLDDTAERWQPNVLPYGREITIRQLLTMTSGMVDTKDVAQSPARYLARVEDASLRARLEALVDRAAADPTIEISPRWWIELAAWQPLLFPPGSQAHYSNIGYELLGQIASRAGAAPLSTLYQERIFGPLGLEATAYDPQGPIAGPHAKGYALAADGTLADVTDRHGGIGAGGGIVSNAEDTATFLVGLMSGKLLGPGWLAEMRGRALWFGGEGTPCGDAAFGWSGGSSGFKTNVWVDANGTRVAVLLLNARSARPDGDGAAGATLAQVYCAS